MTELIQKMSCLLHLSDCGGEKACEEAGENAPAQERQPIDGRVPPMPEKPIESTAKSSERENDQQSPMPARQTKSTKKKEAIAAVRSIRQMYLPPRQGTYMRERGRGQVDKRRL